MGLHFTFDENMTTIIKDEKYDTPLEVELSEDEQTAYKIILDILISNGVDPQVIHLERTREYVKFVSNKFYAFCRLKLIGTTKYIELSIYSKDAKLLKDDPRFDGLVIGVKRFSRIPIVNVSDISSYADVIINAYKWATVIIY